MTMVRGKSRALLPTAGVVAAVATAVSGWAPIAQSAPETGTRDAGVRAPAQDAGDGTYESCGAYFGFGKDSDGVLDVVDFDVVDQNGDDGVAHAVPTDTDVVLVLTNEGGDVLECTPVEVTEADWDAAMADIDLYLPPGASLPAWPGPGHYAYPSVAFSPFIDEFGEIVDVGFRVAGVPADHTLVSPTDVQGLVQHYDEGTDDFISFNEFASVLDLIEADAGAAARAAFAAALPVCRDTEDMPELTDDLVAAVNVLNAYRGFDDQTAEEIGCFTIGTLNANSAFLLGLDATLTYTEQIVLAVPEVVETTTTTAPTTTTTAPVATEPADAAPANAVAGNPSYTG